MMQTGKQRQNLVEPWVTCLHYNEHYHCRLFNLYAMGNNFIYHTSTGGESDTITLTANVNFSLLCRTWLIATVWEIVRYD